MKQKISQHLVLALTLFCTLVVVILLSRTLNDIGMCYEYYLHGGG